MSDDREALLAAIDADLDGVEQALARLDTGTYERCEVCDEPIAADRLAADPVTRRCDLHAGR